MKIKLFCSKEITCMLKASNNHFDDKSKIKPLKIRHFRNSKSEKIAKKIWKKKQLQFWKVRHAQNIIKITPNERGDQTHLLHIYIYIYIFF